MTPEILLRRYRALTAQKYDGSAVRRPGRPESADEIEKLIVRIARDNSSWGYTRTRSALHNLGRNTIERSLLDNGIDSAPLRDKALSGDTYPGAHWNVITLVNLRATAR